MSSKSCSACNDLREYAPEFVVNGVTDDVCENIALNHGLSDAEGHTDCDDLHDVNDCLIGNMDDEVDGFDVCEWKDFMHTYIPNNYETLKAMICALCGLWDKSDDLCKMIDATIAPPFFKVGTLPSADSTTRRCGTIPKKNGSPIMIARPIDSSWDATRIANYKRWQNVGIYYASINVSSCKTGNCQKHEWFYPSTFWYEISEHAERGDVLWYVDKATLQAKCGFSDSLWQGYTESSWTWASTPIQNGANEGKFARLTLTVDPGGMGDNYFGIVFAGTSYPQMSYGTPIGYDMQVTEMTDAPRHHVSACVEDESE